MASIVWPPGLPQSPLKDRYAKELPDLVLRSSVDAGLDKVRRRYTAGPVLHEIGLKLTRSQVAILRTFYLDVSAAGTIPFEWRDHETGDAAVFRFVTRPKFKPRAPRQDGHEFWETETFVLEELPAEASDDDGGDEPASPAYGALVNDAEEETPPPGPEAEADITGPMAVGTVITPGYYPWILGVDAELEPESDPDEIDIGQLYGEAASTCGSTDSSSTSTFMDRNVSHGLGSQGGIFVDC